MEFPQAAGGRSRIAAIGLLALTLGLLIVRFIETLSQSATDIATLYTATLAISDNRAVNVYDPTVLAQLNAAHHYVSSAIYPFSYPPFALLAFRPLALLPFDSARVVWICIAFAAVVGASFLLAETWTRTLRQSNAQALLRQLVEATNLPLRARTFPTLPFALTLAALLLTLPLLDATYWGAATVIAIFFVALALYAHSNGISWLIGASVGLLAGCALWAPLGGIPVLACLVLLTLALRPPWTTLISAIVALVIVLLLPLAVGPLSAYGQMSDAQAFFNQIYVTSLHNTSLSGLIANVLVTTEHTGTTTFATGLQLANLLGSILLVVSLALVIWLSFFGETRPAASAGARDRRSAWPLLAMVVAVSAIAAPVVWPAETSLVTLAALILLGYGLTGEQRTRGTTISMAAVGVALLLCVGAQLSGIDVEYPPQATATMLLTLLRPLAALLVWGVALAIAVNAVLRSVRNR